MHNTSTSATRSPSPVPPGTEPLRAAMAFARHRLARSALGAAAAGLVATLVLSGCGKAAPDLSAAPASMPLPMPASASAAETSVPAAASVFAPAGAGSADAASGRSNKSMSQAQESTAMPMPGQNNDHSAPLGPAKPASSP
jgi:hypothetical protein